MSVHEAQPAPRGPGHLSHLPTAQVCLAPCSASPRGFPCPWPASSQAQGLAGAREAWGASRTDGGRTPRGLRLAARAGPPSSCCPRKVWAWGDQTDGKRALFPRLQIRNPFQNAQVMHMRGGKIGRKRANSTRAPPRTRFQAGRSRLLRDLPLRRGLRSVSRTPPARQNVLASARPSPPAAHGLCPPARSSLPFPS